MKRTPRIRDGKIRFATQTFDGSYVVNEMDASAAEQMLEKADESNLLPGYGLVYEKWYFETEEEEVVLKKSAKKKDVGE